jgi:hypothetical protein
MPDVEKPTYRAYLIGRDNHIRAARLLEVDNDEDAIEAARPLVDGCAVEVWDRGRLVMRLEGDSPKP